MTNQIQLYTWGPALNAPSIDPDCIIAETYLRLLGVNFSIVQCNDPQCSPTGRLPLLKDGPIWVAGTDRILSHFAKRDQDANASLSAIEKADSLAFSSMIQERLLDCLLYTWYADSTNFVKNIRPTYAKLLPFPSRYIAPIQMRKNATLRLSKYKVEIGDSDQNLPPNEREEMKELARTGWHYMYRLARETYALLESKLGDKEYMFGDRATTLDCVVFGHLALHLYPDLAHARLKNILSQEYPRLARYCDRIREQYHTASLPLAEPAQDVPSMWKTFWSNPRSFFSSTRSEAVINTNEQEVKKSESQIDFERKRIWSIAGGVTFLLAYMIYNGILSVQFVDEEFEEYDEEDYEDEDYE